MRHAPSVPEIVRIDTSSIDSAVAHLISVLEPSGGSFNYLEATKRVRAAYKGLHDLPMLLSASPTTKSRVGFNQNMDVVRLAAPRSFSRRTSVFDLSPRKLPYGGDRFASYRVPFFFVEDGVVKGLFLQPRMNTRYSDKQYGLLATLLKKHLFDTEFYGETTELEIVDVCKPLGEKKRVVRVLKLADLELWPDAEVAKHFGVVADALRIIEQEKLVTKVRRPLKDRELPLFD